MIEALEERRGIAGGTLTRLAAGDWIRQGINLIVEGPTGSGKTFLACALAHRACYQKMSAPCRRVLPGTGGRRYGRRSIVIASQIPVDRWPALMEYRSDYAVSPI